MCFAKMSQAIPFRHTFIRMECATYILIRNKLEALLFVKLLGCKPLRMILNFLVQ